jgi:Cu/Ag efflux pump CusA
VICVLSLETTVILRPSSSWRRVVTWYSGWAPDWLRPLLRRVTPDHISREELVSEMDRALTIPGVANAWSMPMRGRVDMLTTGLRTAIGLKIAGQDLREIERIGAQVESLLPSVEGTRGAFAERVGDGYFLDVQWNRAALARAGIAIDQAQAAIEYYVDVAGRDAGSYVADADRTIRHRVALPPGYSLSWSGESETMAVTRRQLAQIVPLTVLLIFVLLYVNTRSLPATLMVLLAVPFSAVGAAGLLYALGYHMSAAAWVGLIALLGVDAETGVFMLLYLEAACERAKRTDGFHSVVELEAAILEGAARRVRPKFMTVTAILAGLLPIMWSTGAGSEVMKRIAAPMIGGTCTSFVLELIVYPTLFYVWKSRIGFEPAAPEPVAAAG